MTPFRAAIVLLCLAAAACTVTTNGTTSSMIVHQPGTIPGFAQTTPGALATMPSAPPPSGRFAGTGRLTSSAGSGCRNEIRVDGMTVSGNQVRYRGFRGTLQAGSFVYLQAGQGYLYGVFNGDTFSGHLWEPRPACTYELTLNHLG